MTVCRPPGQPTVSSVLRIVFKQQFSLKRFCRAALPSYVQYITNQEPSSSCLPGDSGHQTTVFAKRDYERRFWRFIVPFLPK